MIPISHRKTITLSDDTYKKIRGKQAHLLLTREGVVTFSSVTEEIIKKGLSCFDK